MLAIAFAMILRDKHIITSSIQIYILMAEQEDIDPQIHRSYLQKALDCLTAAIRKLNSSDDPVGFHVFWGYVLCDR